MTRLDPDTSEKLGQLLRVASWSDRAISDYLDIPIEAVQRTRATRRSSVKGGTHSIPPGPPGERLALGADPWLAQARRSTKRLAEALARSGSA